MRFDTNTSHTESEEEVFEALEAAQTDEMEEIEEMEDLQDRMERIQELMNNNETNCLHEELEDSMLPNQRGSPHMLSCPCPKCMPRC